jgi:hypothetical protein
MDSITQLYLLVGFLFLGWVLTLAALVIIDNHQWEKRSK